jgi:beta-glucanase (GH16 family)
MLPQANRRPYFLMRRLNPRLAFWIAVFGITFCLNPFTTQAQTYRLVWEDEFNQFDPTTPSSSSQYNRWDVDRTAWNIEVVDAPSNGEIQQYRDSRDNVRLEVNPTNFQDGILVIESKRVNTTQNLGAWTSGRLNTLSKIKFKYGLVEVRAKLPSLVGSWPAIWMMGNNINSNSVGWPRCGEIDIMEMGQNPQWNAILGTLHWNGPNSPAYPNYNHASIGSDNINSNLFVGDSTSAYHVYRFEWTSTTGKWYVDGTLYLTIDLSTTTLQGSPDNPFHKDFFMILNNAIGGSMGGTVNTSGPSSTRMEIDYVRVYQQAATGTILTNKPALPTNQVTMPSGVSTTKTIDLANYPHAITVTGSIPGMTATVTNTSTPYSGFTGSTGKARLVLSGTPSQTGTFTLQLQASNVAGTSSLSLPVVVTGTSWSLQNGNFEQGSGNLPYSWSGSTSTTANLFTDSITASPEPLSAGWTRTGSVSAAAYEVATTSSVYYGSGILFTPYSGSASLKVYGPYMANDGGGTTRFYRTASAVAGNTYQFQAYAHTGSVDAIRGGNVCRLCLEFLNSANAVLGTQYSTSEMNASSARGSWSLLQTPLAVAPTGTVSIRAGTEFIQPAGWSTSDSNGCVYWDDFKLESYFTTTSLASNTSGQALRLFSSGWVEQTVQAEPNATYLFSGVNAAGSGSVKASVTYQNDAGTAVAPAIELTFLSGQTWQLSSTSPASATRALLRLSNASGTVDINETTWGLLGRSRLYNGGAETTDNNLPIAWQTIGTSSTYAALTSSGTQSGAYALRVGAPSTGSNTYSGWTQDMLVSTSGIPWLAEVWSRNSIPLAESSQGLLRLEFLNSSGSVMLTGESILPKSSSFSRSQIYLRAPVGSTQARLSLLLNQVNYSAGELVFDTAEARPLTESDYLASRANTSGISTPDLSPTSDPDNDGVSSAAEFLWGTDPFSASSVTRLGLGYASTPNTLKLKWTAVPGCTYMIDQSPNVETMSTPTQIFEVTPSSTAGSISPFTAEYDVPMTSSKSFYRIRPK